MLPSGAPVLWSGADVIFLGGEPWAKLVWGKASMGQSPGQSWYGDICEPQVWNGMPPAHYGIGGDVSHPQRKS